MVTRKVFKNLNQRTIDGLLQPLFSSHQLPLAKHIRLRPGHRQGTNSIGTPGGNSNVHGFYGTVTIGYLFLAGCGQGLKDGRRKFACWSSFPHLSRSPLPVLKAPSVSLLPFRAESPHRHGRIPQKTFCLSSAATAVN